MKVTFFGQCRFYGAVRILKNFFPKPLNIPVKKNANLEPVSQIVVIASMNFEKNRMISISRGTIIRCIKFVMSQVDVAHKAEHDSRTPGLSQRPIEIQGDAYGLRMPVFLVLLPF